MGSEEVLETFSNLKVVMDYPLKILRLVFNPVYGGNGISGYHNSFNMKGCYIIIGRVGVYCGNVRKVEGEFWLTDNAFRLIYKENEQNPFFILYLLNILDLHQYANAAAQPVISNLTLKSINVPLPLSPYNSLLRIR